MKKIFFLVVTIHFFINSFSQTGEIIKVIDDLNIEINLGKNQGINKGDKFIVLGKGQHLHPATGRVTQLENMEVAEIFITETYPEYSKGIVIEKKGEISIGGKLKRSVSSQNNYEQPIYKQVEEINQPQKETIISQTKKSDDQTLEKTTLVSSDKIVDTPDIKVLEDDKYKKYLLGGSIGFDHTTYTRLDHNEKTSSNYSLLVSPFFGFFISEIIVLGVSTETTWSKSIYLNIDYESYFSSTKYYLSPFLRVYFNSNTFLLGQVNVGYRINKNFSANFTESNYTNSSTFFGFSAGVGYSFQFIKNTYIEPLFRYNLDYINHETSDITVKSSKIIFSIGLVAKL